ncbi:MAG TPA: YjhX family toxin [Sphingobium sp.]
MNISRTEQRVLHELAKGGLIKHYRDARGHIHMVECVTRDGFILSDCDLATFGKLRRKRLIESHDSSPYRISRLGRESVRSQLDNR